MKIDVEQLIRDIRGGSSTAGTSTAQQTAAPIIAKPIPTSAEDDFRTKQSRQTANIGKVKEVGAAAVYNNPAYAYAQIYGNDSSPIYGEDGKVVLKSGTGTAEKSSKKEHKPGAISALGAGDYGQSNQTKFDQTMNAAAYSTAAGLKKLAADVSKPTGELSMGESAQAAKNSNGNVGEAQRAAEEEKRERAEKGWVGKNRRKLNDDATELYQRSADYTQKAKEGLGDFGQLMVDTGIAGAQFVGDMAINFVAPGAGTAAMLARAYGSGALDAQHRGLSEGEQQLAGVKSAAIEFLTEKMFGTASKLAYGAGFVRSEKVVGDVVNRLAKTNAGRTALKVIIGANEEGLEEVLSDILNPIADRILKLDEGKGDWSTLTDDLNTEQMLEDYAVGAILGLFGGGANVVSGQYSAENATQRARENYQRRLVSAGLAAEEGSEARTVAEKYKKIIDQSTKRGKRNLSDSETRDLESKLRSTYIAEDAASVKIRLAQLGAEADDTTALAIAKTVNGEELSKSERKAFKDSLYSQRIVNEMTDAQDITSNEWYTNRNDGSHRTASDIVADVALGRAETQLNIDNAEIPAYTNNATGGAQNVSGRSIEANSDGVPGLYGTSDTGHQGRSELGGTVERSGRVLSTQSQDTIRSRGVDVVETQDVSANSAAFSSALDEARIANPKNGWAVTPKTTAEINENGIRVYMNESGSVGYGIAPDGDIEAVFANKSKGAPRLATASMIPEAIANGGTKLDCYGLGLVKLYSQHGFIPVAKVKFNSEYANDGWTPDKGTPDIYFMMATDLDPDSVVQNYGNYPVLTQEQLDALPVMEYDEAYAYRDSLLEQQQSDLPKGTGAAELGFTGELSPAEQWVAEAQGKGDSALHPISREQQQNLAEQQGRAPQELPKVDLMGNLTSKTASTLMNSGITPQEMSNAILEDAAQGRFSRIAYDDNAAIDKANDEIENGKGRYQGALERWRAEADSGKVSKDTVVMGICLYNNAVTNGDYATALDIAAGLVDIGKNTGQAMQAMRILNKLSPEGRIYVAAKAVDKINREVQERYGDKAPDISVDEDLYAEYLDALKSGDDAAIKASWDAIEQNIADQIPANWVDKLNAWRYLSMLGNIRTHVRNIVGNAGFMPVRMMKNAMSAGIESVVDKISADGIERTKAALNPFSEADRALLHLTWGDYQNSIDQILSGGKYNNTFNGVEDKRTIFKLKPFEAARKANSTALNVEDSWFSQPAYAESLASWLKSNGYDAKSFTDGSMPTEKLDAARAYAVKEAQKATYRDANRFSSWVSSLRMKTGSKPLDTIGNAVIEGAMPFKKTPANILVRAVEYSPIGFAKTVTVDSFKLRRGDITAAEYIDNLSQGLTGTALVGLGVLLASLGLLSGGSSGDDKQDAFDATRGKQDYAINIGDWSFTLDWLAPESMPLFVGVELYNRKSSGEPFSIGALWEALSDITAPMLDMSMMQGVNEVLTGLDYADGSALSTVITKATGSLVSQFVPTIFGQIERVFTENRQTTYIDRDSDLSANTQRFIGNLLNKVPGVDYNQIDYIDAWGRTESTGNGFERFVNNMINPAYTKKSGATEVDDELQRLYDLGETGVFPQRAPQNTKINGEYMTAEEYVKYAKERGQVSLETVKALVNSRAYKNMSDADKAAAIESAYDYADAMAKKTVNSGVKTPSWVEGAKSSGNAAQYIADTSMMRTVDTDGNGSYSSAEKARGLINGGYSGSELVEKVREYMTTESGNCELGDILERSQNANIPDNVTLDVYEFESSARADKDENGKSISGSKKQKVFDYINSLDLSAQQKKTLYYSFYKS